MTPEEYEKLYGYAPSQELQEAWASGPQAVQSYKDKPVAEAIHAIVEPFTTRGVGGDPDDAEFASGIGGMNRGLASLLNPAVMVSGAANVVDNWANPAAENSLMDYIWGGLDVAGPVAKAAKPLAQAYRANMPNLLEYISNSRFTQAPGTTVGDTVSKMAGYTPPGGYPDQRVSFYSGNPIATAAALGEGLYRGTKSFVKQLYNLSDSHRWGTKKVSRLQVDGIKKHFETSESVMADPKSWVTDKSGVTKLSTKAKESLKRSEKTVAGDLNTMYALAEREGYEISDVVRAWGDIHWDTSRHINSVDLAPQLRDLKSVSADAAPTENSAMIADMMNGIWKMGDDYILAIQKPRKSSGAASSTTDAQMSRSYANAAKAYHAGARTADEFRAAGVKRVVDGENGSVLVQYSSDRMSDLFKGGFNAIAELTPKGKTTFWVSDKFDLLSGPAQTAMEVGMKNRLLTVMQPKTITTPVVGAGKGAAKKRKVPTRAKGPSVKSREEAAMKAMMADDDIPAAYKAKFMLTRYGLPTAGAGGLLSANQNPRNKTRY
jgi:hypothetical protein